MTKKFIAFATGIYTLLNLYVFGSFAFKAYWWEIILVNNGGLVVFGILISLFLNMAIILYLPKIWANLK
jgi:hypothetical protein